jgi:predicted RNA-binding protein with PUA-like domain
VNLIAKSDMPVAQRILEKIDDAGCIEKALPLMAEYLAQKDPNPQIVIAIFKANIAAVAALEALGVKSRKGQKVVNNNHLTIFNFTPEQWQALPQLEREVIERLRVKAAAAAEPVPRA